MCHITHACVIRVSKGTPASGRAPVYVCVCVRACACVCVCVQERYRERDRASERKLDGERVCAYVCVCICMCGCVYVCLGVFTSVYKCASCNMSP